MSQIRVLIGALVLPFMLVSQARSQRQIVISPALLSQNVPVPVHIFNRAAIGHGDLLAMGRELTRIYARGGILLEVTEGSLEEPPLPLDFSPINAVGHGCKTQRQRRVVAVNLMLHAPPGLVSGALGFSLPCAAFGIDSTIFVDRCERVCGYTPATLNRILACAVAHELGHVMLRTEEHSASGLMRGTWDKGAPRKAFSRSTPIRGMNMFAISQP